MNRKEEACLSLLLRYFLLIGLGTVMIYPLCWMIGASFRTNSELFSSAGIVPMAPTLDGYRNEFKGYKGMNLLRLMGNTYKLMPPKVVFTVTPAVVTPYGPARLRFMGKSLLFVLLLSILFLPRVVLNVPQYVLFSEVGWLNSYLPTVIPSILAGDTFFVYMLIQFLRGIPRELEEAMEIDGCSMIGRLWYVIVPMLKPSIVSCVLFQLMRASSDLVGPLTCINSVRKYPVSMFLRMSVDIEAGFDWNRVLTMSLLVIIPSLAILFMAQDSFVNGITAGGVKG